MKIIGSYVSPLCPQGPRLPGAEGAYDYEIDPITPFFGDEEFARLSPLRRIPVLIHERSGADRQLGDLRLAGRGLSGPSAASRQRPPTAPAPAGSRNMPTRRLGDVFIWGLFYQKRVHPAVWGEPGDAGADREDAGRGRAGGARLSGGRSCRKRASCSARSASPTSPSPASSAPRPMPISRSTPARWPNTAALRRARARP